MAKNTYEAEGIEFIIKYEKEEEDLAFSAIVIKPEDQVFGIRMLDVICSIVELFADSVTKYLVTEGDLWHKEERDRLKDLGFEENGKGLYKRKKHE